MIKSRTWCTLNDNTNINNPESIVVMVWKNKEFHKPGCPICLNLRTIKSWEEILGFLTKMLKPRFGEVKKLYNMESKQQVHCLQDIKNKGQYMASGLEKPKFNECYKTKDDLRIIQQRDDRKLRNILNNNKVGNLLFMTKKIHRTVVYVMVSGRLDPPKKIVFIEEDFTQLEMTIDYLSIRLDVSEGIHSFAKVDGSPITLSRFKHGGLYIAVPFGDRFMFLDYVQICMDSMHITPEDCGITRLKKFFRCRNDTLAKRKANSKESTDEEDGEVAENKCRRRKVEIMTDVSNKCQQKNVKIVTDTNPEKNISYKCRRKTNVQAKENVSYKCLKDEKKQAITTSMAIMSGNSIKPDARLSEHIDLIGDGSIDKFMEMANETDAAMSSIYREIPHKLSEDLRASSFTAPEPGLSIQNISETSLTLSDSIEKNDSN